MGSSFQSPKPKAKSLKPGTPVGILSLVPLWSLGIRGSNEGAKRAHLDIIELILGAKEVILPYNNHLNEAG